MQKDMHDPEHSTGEAPDAARTSWRTVLGGVVAVMLLAILGYVGYQILHLLNPPNTYETVLTATVEDKVEADGVVLFNETVIPGGGDMGYLVEDGARVSAGTVVAEVYTNSGQSALRASLTSLNEQIELLQRAENVSSTQVDTMIQERTTALYDLLDAADRGALADMDTGREDYLLAQNKILVVTGEASDFASQIAGLQAQAAQLQSQLGTPAQITAPLTGYFVRSASTRQLTQPPWTQGWTPPSPAAPARWCRASAGATAASARRNRPRNCCGPTAPPSPARCASASPARPTRLCRPS